METPTKPLLPYHAGSQLRAYADGILPEPDPARAGYSQSSLGRAFLDLKVAVPLQVGDGTPVQVFTVVLCGSSGEKKYSELKMQPQTLLVAKAFDPLYCYDGDDRYLDAFREVERLYAHEVQSYQVLSDYQGQGIPKFYGSFSLCLLVSGTTSRREVPMVLIGCVKGSSMMSLKPEQIPQSVRQHILRTMIELESSIYENNVDMLDLAPRNTMLIRPDGVKPEVVFIDFADVQFRSDRHYWDGDIPRKLSSQYISPLLRWKGGPRMGFEGWADWDWDSWLEREFAHTKNTITPEMGEHWLGGGQSICEFERA
ncbi:unnamed protein product [Penicillium pancosmium]